MTAGRWCWGHNRRPADVGSNGVAPIYNGRAAFEVAKHAAHRYEGLEPLLATPTEKLIAPAEGKVKALQERRRMIEAELTKPQ